tara:strand:- start:109 stop:219 length:111 start_codon:yes stop_codon:yes gene_type:complete
MLFVLIDRFIFFNVLIRFSLDLFFDDDEDEDDVISA